MSFWVGAYENNMHGLYLNRYHRCHHFTQGNLSLEQIMFFLAFLFDMSMNLKHNLRVSNININWICSYVNRLGLPTRPYSNLNLPIRVFFFYVWELF